jgi:hypothetical protein
MNDQEYETYVAGVVRSLSFAKSAAVFTHRRYEGIRQPGRYEIDVACEFWLDNALFFLLIVECKNWKRPIDRPQVQKLIQTRDAISAHKCAMASPVGYTAEAIKVAKANGVALWVVATGVFETAAGGGLAALATCWTMADCLRSNMYEALMFDNGYLKNISVGIPNLVPHDWLARDVSGRELKYLATGDFRSSYDPCVSHVLAYALRGDVNANSLTRRAHDLVQSFRRVLETSGMKTAAAATFVASFVCPMVIIGFSITHLFQRLRSFDQTLDHYSISLQGQLEWFEKYGRRFFIYPSNAVEFVRIESNTIWANAVWNLRREGFIVVESGET